MKPSLQSKSTYILELARELLDDIEMNRIAPENLILKAMRLARITEDERMTADLGFELYGFRGKADAHTWAKWVGRYTDVEKGLGYWDPLAAIYSRILAAQTQLQALRVPDLSYAPHTVNEYDRVGNLLNPLTQGIGTILS